MSRKAGNRWNNIGQALLSDGFSIVIPSPGVVPVCEGTGRIGDNGDFREEQPVRHVTRGPRKNQTLLSCMISNKSHALA